MHAGPRHCPDLHHTGWHTDAMGDDKDDTVTLHLPPDAQFAELPRVALASLLRIHRIDPGDIGDLSTSVQHTATEMTATGNSVDIHLRVTDTQVCIDLDSAGRTVRLSAPRS